MNLFRSKGANALTASYVKNLQEGVVNLDNSTRELVELLLKDMVYSYNSEKVARKYFLDLFKQGKVYSVCDLFSGEREKALVYLLGEEQAVQYREWLTICSRTPYSAGYYRRSIRSVRMDLHLSKAISALTEFLAVAATGVSFRLILGMEEAGSDEMKQLLNELNWEEVIAVGIDRDNPEVVEAIREMFEDETTQGKITYPLFRAIFASGNREMYELAGKMLLAARLQEGLRQAIAETMDGGRPEAFIYMFNVIRENDLLRFSSVKRALGTWTGLYQEGDDNRIIRKISEVMAICLHDPSHVEACLESTDTLEVYMALWTKAFYDLENVTGMVDRLLEEGVKHKLQTLFYFIGNIHDDTFKHQVGMKALTNYADDDSLLVGYINHFMAGMHLYRYSGSSDKKPEEYFSGIKEAEEYYYRLKEIAGRIKKSTPFTPYLFPWYACTLEKDRVLYCMLFIAYLTKEPALIDDICGYVSQMEVGLRTNLIQYALKEPQSPIQLNVLVEALGDRSPDPRVKSYEILKEYTLQPEHYLQLEGMLRFKAGDLRQNLIKLLLKQEPQELEKSVERLLKDKLAEKRLAAMDMLLSIKDKEGCREIFTKGKEWVQEVAKPSSKEKILIEQIAHSSASEAGSQYAYTRENGLGLIEEVEYIQLESIELDRECKLADVFFLSEKQIKEIYEELDNLFEQNAGYEYINNWGGDSLLGNRFDKIKGHEQAEKELDKYPLADTWREFYQQNIKDFKTLFHLRFATSSIWVRPSYKNAEQMYDNFFSLLTGFYGFDYTSLNRELFKFKYSKKIDTLLDALYEEYCDRDYSHYMYKNILGRLINYLTQSPSTLTGEGPGKMVSVETFSQGLASNPALWGTISDRSWSSREQKYIEEDKVTDVFSHPLVNYWRNSRFWDTNEEFKTYFTYQYSLYRAIEMCRKGTLYSSQQPGIWLLMKAYEAGLLSESSFLKELLTCSDSEDIFNKFVRQLNITSVNKDEKISKFNRDGYANNLQLYNRIKDRILEIELKRGDSPTVASSFACIIPRVTGAGIFVDLLKALGKDTFEQGYYYYNNTFTKRSVLSRLLGNCYPEPEDNARKLAELLKETDISEKRLVEAAMYAPQWLEIVQECIGWKGLFSAAYYFHAHMNEGANDQKKAIIARYTPIDVADLQQGAFDINWFREAYKGIGEKRFEVVYGAAKYISSGNGHTRGRKFADAVSGKMNLKEVRKEVEAKRNKDLLMSYALIPLNKRSKKDLPERYQYLQQFLKESKEFGAQRQESEKKAVEIALQNLARNAGYDDVTRLVWSMETLLVKEMAHYFTPKELEGFQVYVEVDENGKSSLKYLKDGKELKSVPAKLKKNKYIDELKAVHKKLKDQYSRSRVMLEQAMEDSTRFYVEEISVLTENPVVWPLLKDLVFVNGEGVTGFFRSGNLLSFDGSEVKQESKAEIRIAHPVDLYNQEAWYGYQKNLFDYQVRQPFKQVFRELYVKTREEEDRTDSRRYAGNQIQPQKTVAVLKGRRWIANYEAGLQKVYYKENIVATIYAMADWFSPSDIEAPTLEWVSFYDRKTNKSLEISKIPDILFSEVMRDVDLAVSVAHAGGVDPETSHSTIEMRSAILGFTLPLFRINNVELKGSHAFITGKMGSYTIHLGSGVIHQQAGAAINVLPVHSQHRGKLFLPFVDDDPKTAEIITKVLLFAEDEKIKDPFILEQIKRK